LSSLAMTPRSRGLHRQLRETRCHSTASATAFEARPRICAIGPTVRDVLEGSMLAGKADDRAPVIDSGRAGRSSQRQDWHGDIFR
jgi:hypothetical protein